MNVNLRSKRHLGGHGLTKKGAPKTWAFFALFGVGLSACSSSGSQEHLDRTLLDEGGDVPSAPQSEGPVEGDRAGACSDGLDNDQDGWVDCEDPSCGADQDCWDFEEEAADRVVSLSGQVFDGLDLEVEEGHFCLEVFNVSGLLAGGSIEEIASGETAWDGSWEIRDVPLAGEQDLLVLTHDCVSEEPKIVDSGTHIPARALRSLRGFTEGFGRLTDDYRGIELMTVNREDLDAMEHELNKEEPVNLMLGSIFIHVVDAAGDPNPEATVRHTDFVFDVYYPERGDSYFELPDGDPRRATGAHGAALVPGGWTGTYEAMADGLDFNRQTTIQFEGMIEFSTFRAL